MKLVLQEQTYIETLAKIGSMKIILPLITLWLMELSACMLIP
jgi:hypothetical protein